jgi:hypothetical protein
MMTIAPERAEQVVAGWRAGLVAVDGWENPSGPLYPSGKYAEADITMSCPPESGQCGTACTYSRTRQCC